MYEISFGFKTGIVILVLDHIFVTAVAISYQKNNRFFHDLKPW